MAVRLAPLLLLLLLVRPDGSSAQPGRASSSAWRQRIRWESNGRLYSLFNSAPQFQPPRGGPSGGAQSLLLSAARGRPSGRASAAETLEVRGFPGGEDGSGAGGPSAAEASWAEGPVASGAARERDQDHQRRNATSGSQGFLRGGGGDADDGGEAGGVPRAGSGPSGWLEPGGNEIGGAPVTPRPRGSAGDDPRNPFKTRNSIFYNVYPNQPRPQTPHSGGPPGTNARPGYGTRYFHNGLPDLIPDPYFIQAATYIQRVQMYALRCAAEENCLARSAYRPGVSDISYRVLLRFPQRVKNQGTADFLPVKPQHAWEWHSCHQHFHSMDAFSNYDLLDAVSHRKVAEGHKASFCLEDTTCDAGFRRRYACTAHTQGLGPGCYDTYNANIDCQWIDITEVPPGNYILKVTVNPDFLVAESDFTNNVATCDIVYTGTHATARHCRIARSWIIAQDP